MASSRPGLSCAHFYCTFGDTASHDPINILGSLVAQLSGEIPSIVDSIRPLYEEAQVQRHGRQVDVATLEDAIIKHSTDKQVLLPIDGINESSRMDLQDGCSFPGAFPGLL